MPDYFGKRPEERIREDRSRLRERFAPWQNKVKDWDEMLYPAKLGWPGGSAESRQVPSKRLFDLVKKSGPGSVYRSNFIRRAMDIYMNRMTRAEPKIAIGSLEKSALEVEKASRTERLCHGILNYLNDQVSESAGGTGWLRQMYSFSGMPGKLCSRINVQPAKRKDGDVIIDWDLLDPTNCYHEFTKDRRLFISEYETSVWGAIDTLRTLGLAVPAELNQQAQDGKKPGVVLTDYWLEAPGDDGERKVWNAILIGETMARFGVSKKFQHLPVIVTTMGTMGRKYQSPRTKHEGPVPVDYVLRHAEPFFASLEETLKQIEEITSLEIDSAALSINPPFFVQSADGSYSIPPELMQVPGAGVSIPSEVLVSAFNQNLKVFVADHILARLQRDLDTVVPPALFGETSPGEAGYMFNLRTDSAENALLEYANGPAQHLKLGLQEIIHQLLQIKGAKISLHGKSTKGENLGQFFYEDFTEKDIPKSYAVDIKLAPHLPRDDMRALQIFQLGVTSGAFSK